MTETAEKRPGDTTSLGVRMAYANFRAVVWEALECLRLDNDPTKLNEIRAALQDEFESGRLVCGVPSSDSDAALDKIVSGGLRSTEDV